MRMTLRENVPLSSLTTFRIGGAARYVVTCESVEDIQNAIALAHDRVLPWYVLGGGSNVLAPDEGFNGMLLQIAIPGMEFIEEEDAVRVVVGAGESWDSFVREVATRGLWGVENLAGIPGSVGASPVQNIGAYGAEVSTTIESVQVLDTKDGSQRTYTNKECFFEYRDSVFKKDASLIITQVTFILSRIAIPTISYADITARRDAGATLTTPNEIGDVVREIRAEKFPDLKKEGTAGSFFENPTITAEHFASLREKYPELPGYPSAKGVKVSLAWILDKTLELRGYTKGSVRLFERQPLVLVAMIGAHESEVDALAQEVTSRVYEATNILIEREVRSLRK